VGYNDVVDIMGFSLFVLQLQAPKSTKSHEIPSR